MTGGAYRICTRCIMDTTDPDIQFDEAGQCNHCTEALVRMREQILPPEEREQALQQLAARVKAEGQGKEYDCIIGVSGGVDSTTVAYHVKRLGLRPLAVHFDNGWNSELAVDNIKRALEHLKIDLFTYVVDWEEFRDLQVSLLKASVPNAEIPSDHGITATLFGQAARRGIRFILSGSNLVTEAIMPMAWGHYNQDKKHMLALHRRFGSVPLRTMPTISVPDYLLNVFVRKMRQIPFLNYIDYNRDEAKRLLADELGWRDYGGKHYESVWTRFYQGHYLPVKFGFDKRKAHYSTIICSGGMTRDEALAKMAEPIYPEGLLEVDKAFVIKKFGFSEAEFAAIMEAPPRKHTDFPSNYFLFHTLSRYRRAFRKVATSA